MTALRERERIVVTGGSGFLGQHVVSELQKHGVSPDKIIIPRSSEFDLRNPEMARRAVEGADIVIHLAANVGGIGKNRDFPSTLLVDNSLIGINTVDAARLAGVEKFVAVGTVCSYPKVPPNIPFKEEDLFKGYPEETNAPYGEAKRLLIVHLWAARDQYDFNGIILLPTNLTGPGDHFGDGAHVIPDMIRKVYAARIKNLPSVTFWGNGSPTREFLYVEDAARGITIAAEKYDQRQPVNLGSSHEVSMRELAEKVITIMKYHGTVVWDTSKPNGQPRRKLDITRAKEELGFEAKMDIDTGIARTIEYYEREIAPLAFK